MIGHNRPNFDNVVEDSLVRGVYLVHLQALQRCIKDPRLDQRHRLVLVALTECINSKSAVAYPGRAWLAANIAHYVHGEPRRYSEGTIANTLSELVEFGYLYVTRRAPESGKRALSHYAVYSPSVEELQSEIALACAAIRALPKRQFPRPEVNSGVDVNSVRDVKNVVDIRTGQEVQQPIEKQQEPVFEVNSGSDVNSRRDVNFFGAEVNSGRGQELVKELVEEKEEDKSSSSSDCKPDDDYDARPMSRDMQEAVRLYNLIADEAGLPLVRSMRLSDKRQRLLRARLKDAGGLRGWAEAMSNLHNSKFLRGQSKSGWMADFDFCIRPDSFDKLWSGKYTDAHLRKGPTGDTPAASALRDVYEQLREGGDP